MDIVIKIENKIVELTLMDKRKVKDKLIFTEDHDLSDILMPNIDKLLKRNRLAPEDIGKASLKTDLEESFTAYRIAQSVVNAFNWSLGVDKQGS